MRRHLAVATIAIVGLLFSAGATHATTAEPTPCGPETAGGPFLVDADCIDPTYASPVIDSTSETTDPVPLHVVSGHFEGTDKTFRILLPSEEQWEGRFFQFTYPLEGQEPADSVKFGAENGGYTVQTSGGAGYRHLAAAAKFSRTVAAEHYGVAADSITGYVYGWSGGSFQTIGAMENTRDVWQGGVPIVLGVETSIPNNFAVRNLAAFVLRDQREQIIAALRPGGSGDPYAGLDPIERDALTEATRMGVPLRAWEDFDYLANSSSLQGLGYGVRAADPSYVEDFWDDPRYLGAEQSELGQLFRDALAEDDTLDNRWNLALLAYHRYQVPTRAGFSAFDQYRDANGHPIYPQRPELYSANVARGVSGGAAYSGSINGKVIVVEGTLDSDAFPWHGDWYADQVRASLGADAGDSFRLWYVDNADHNPYDRQGAAGTRLVGYLPVVFQALTDVAAWAESGVAPPHSTAYDFSDGQISLPEDADARRGPQPVLDLEVRGATAEHPATVGKKVRFTAAAEVPRGAGKVVSMEWDFDGDGTYEPAAVKHPKNRVVVNAAHSYAEPGTYYVSVRVGSQRDGDSRDKLTVIRNLDRVRVVVR
jgi:hypothetical protein